MSRTQNESGSETHVREKEAGAQRTPGHGTGAPGERRRSVRGWFSASSSDASLCTSTTKVKWWLQIEAL